MPDLAQRDALHSAHAGMVPIAVRHVRKGSVRARRHDVEDLEQTAHLALLDAATNCTDSATFHGFAWQRMLGELRNWVAEQHYGNRHRQYERQGLVASSITNLSAIEHLGPRVAQGGDAVWVRTTIGRTASSAAAMFASAGYAVDDRAQQVRLGRALAEMMP